MIRGVQTGETSRPPPEPSPQRAGGIAYGFEAGVESNQEPNTEDNRCATIPYTDNKRVIAGPLTAAPVRETPGSRVVGQRALKLSKGQAGPWERADDRQRQEVCWVSP